jgi:hypothetical protein
LNRGAVGVRNNVQPFFFIDLAELPSMNADSLLLACLGLVLAYPSDAAEPRAVARVAIRGQGESLGETPILVPVDAAIPTGAYSLQMPDGRTSRASIFHDGTKTWLAAIVASIPAEGELVGSLIPTNGGGGVKLITQGDDVEVTVDGKPFTTYRPHNGPKPTYYPLFGPSGKLMTRSFPMKDVPGEKRDHPHQRSMWFTHGKVNGIDFWSEQKGHGSIVETSRSITSGSPIFGMIRTSDDWLGPDNKRICSDQRIVRFFTTSTTRIIDFDITIKATDGPVTFGDTKEGMFGVRVATSMDVDSKQGGKITNSGGLNDAATWGKPATWVDYTGPVDGETVGVAILNHPASFRHPTTWHVRTYGLFAANPFGLHDFGMKKTGEHTLPAGESIHFGYRVILHKGDTASAGLPASYAGYAKPPEVKVTLE